LGPFRNFPKIQLLREDGHLFRHAALYVYQPVMQGRPSVLLAGNAVKLRNRGAQKVRRQQGRTSLSGFGLGHQCFGRLRKTSVLIVIHIGKLVGASGQPPEIGDAMQIRANRYCREDAVETSADLGWGRHDKTKVEIGKPVDGDQFPICQSLHPEPLHEIARGNRLRLVPADRTADLQPATQIVSGLVLKRATLCCKAVLQLTNVCLLDYVRVSSDGCKGQFASLPIKQRAHIGKPCTKHGMAGAFRHVREKVDMRAEIGRDCRSTAIGEDHHRPERLLPLLGLEMHACYGRQHYQCADCRRVGRFRRAVAGRHGGSVEIAQLIAVGSCCSIKRSLEVEVRNIFGGGTGPGWQRGWRVTLVRTCIASVIAHPRQLSAWASAPRPARLHILALRRLPFWGSQQRPSRVVDEQLAVGAGGEAGAHAVAGEAGGVDAGGGDPLLDDEEYGFPR
jgi:hypothetical protein